EGGIVQPFLREGAFRPVLSAMALEQMQVEDLLHHGGEVDQLETGEPARQFSVEEGAGTQIQPGQARQVRGGGVDDPLLSVEDGTKRAGEFRTVGLRIEKESSCTPATDLDEKRPVIVTEAGRPFCVDCEGP